MNILVTGGAGFIGSALIRQLIHTTDHAVINVDALTYAGNLASLESVQGNPRYRFEQNDIRDGVAMRMLLERYQPDAVVHLAAESHVDRSIDSPMAFIDTNITGTAVLLEAVRAYWRRLAPARAGAFRFLHVSTDEVYGDIGEDAAAVTEAALYRPASPYAASKAASDHLVQAWHRTWGIPTLISHSSNNYGPCQYPEKLIPHMIIAALHNKPLPLYGDGLQVRDWLHVDDHAAALLQILLQGRIGATYNVGGASETHNRKMVESLCDLIDELAVNWPEKTAAPRRSLITHVSDRPGHDRRYALDCSRIRGELGWQPLHSLDSGLRHTVQWYLAHPQWWQPLLLGPYRLERQGQPT
jgi:dTDP-glucose 4,6-dehydratase